MIRLKVLQGEEKGRVFESPEAQLSIGRSPEATVQLSDAHLSAEHGIIFREQGGYVYRDLRSTNGSAVEHEGERFALDGGDRAERAIEDGDLLVLGSPASPVILRCSLPLERQRKADTHRVIATRTINDLREVSGKVESGPEVSALYRAVKSLGGAIELERVLEAVTSAVLTLIPRASHVAILLRDSGGEERFVPVLARARSGSEIKGPVLISRALLRRVLDEKAAVLAANAADELGHSESIMAADIKSTAAVPLQRGSRILGVIEVDNRDGAGLFTERDLELLMLLGEQAALAIDNAQLVRQLELAHERAEGENLYLRARQPQPSFEAIIGESPAMKAIFQQIERVVDTRASVCIGGETGTGKELIANAIHYQSQRRDKMLVAQNCAALPESLLESELFGHKRGAFTGADRDKKGLFEIADGGTLFLDEVAEMPLTLQAKLLRVLQEGEVRPVGATRSKRVDVRIICATNRQLEQEVEAGRFRQDLFYRLMVFPIVLPPLRERREDIAALAQHFLKRYCNELRKAVSGFSQPALNQLRAYDWPGNIRELENEVQRLVIQVDEGAIIDSRDLSAHIHELHGVLERVSPSKGTLKDMMAGVERWLLAEALKEHGNNKTKTAASLGITREGLHKKLNRHGI